MQRDIEAQERAHTFQLEELKREMIADVGMLQATHMQEMSVAHERALATVASTAPITQLPDIEPKVALHVVSSGLGRMKHSCALARASCRMASDGLRSLSKEIMSGLACAADACSLMQQQWQHEQQLWKQRYDVHMSGQILTQSVEMLQEQHRHQVHQQHPDSDARMQHQQQHQLQEDQSHHDHAQVFTQHLHGQSQLPPQSMVENVSVLEDNRNSSRHHHRHVRFMLADGPHQPGVSPAPPSHPSAHGTQSNVAGVATNFNTQHTGSLDRSAQQDEDSLDESLGDEGSGTLQSYLGDVLAQNVSATGDSDGGVKFAQLWPPHQLSSFPAASASTLNIMMQPHSPATIANQLISHARGSAANALQGKPPPISANVSPGVSSRMGSNTMSLSPSMSAAEQPSDELGADFEMRARELYGDYVWIVQKTQVSDEIGQSIQVCRIFRDACSAPTSSRLA
jgi:hypothetical protein